MEDCESIKSNESLATSDEFDFVNEKPSASKTPTLNISNGRTITELKSSLSDAMQEAESNLDIVHPEGKKIGHSLFYTSPVEPGTDPLSMNQEKEIGKAVDMSASSSPTEKQDEMKPDYSDEEGIR